MRVYVCGPMSGYRDLNAQAFRDAASSLQRIGFTTVVPHDIEVPHHEGSCPTGPVVMTQGGHGVACFLRADLAALLDCDRIYVLRGWEASVGARLEIQVAAACGIKIEFQS